MKNLRIGLILILVIASTLFTTPALAASGTSVTTMNDAQYLLFNILAHNIMYAATCNDAKGPVEINTKVVDTGMYSFSLPQGWGFNGDNFNLNLTRSGETIGSISVYNYYPDSPISQFQGNHAQTLSDEELRGFNYPAAKALIRRSQPAAANDDSYVDELHIYILLADLHSAIDLCFDSSKVDDQMVTELAKSIVPNETAIKNTATDYK